MVDYRQVLGVMQRSGLKTRRLLARVDPKRISREEILNLAFREGEEVIDRVTGERGRVTGGTTTYITKVPGA